MAVLLTVMKVVGYLRVSTDRQAEEGLGLDVQEHAIKIWAKKNGHRVVLWTRDEGVSGAKDLDAREGLPEALGAIGDGVASGVVVYRLDRLARDLIIQETVLAEVKRVGGEVFSTSPAESAYLTDDPDDPSRALIRQVLGAVAQYEKSMINLRLRSGRKRKSAQGGYAYGAPPLGFRAEGKALVPHPDEAVVVDRIRALRADGASLREIGAVLESEGLRTKRGGSRWHPPVIARVLARAA